MGSSRSSEMGGLGVPVLGGPDPLGPLSPVEPQAFPEQLQERLVGRAERLGYIGAFFAYCAHQPDALIAFMDFTDHLSTSLPARVAEVVGLAASSRLDNSYELEQHRRLAAGLGCSPQWMTEASSSGPAESLETTEQAVRDLTLAVVAGNGRYVRGQVSIVAGEIGQEGCLAVLMLIGRFAAHAYVANALELTVPVPSASGESGLAAQ